VSLSPTDLEFLQDHHAAAMITVAPDGVADVAGAAGPAGAAKAVRVGLALVDGKLWSSGTADRIRTRRLREDPRCTLFVFDPGFAWRTLETTVTILEGPDAPQLNLELFRRMQGKPTGPLSWFGSELEEEDFLRTMVEEQRVIYEFEVQRSYGLP